MFPRFLFILLLALGVTAGTAAAAVAPPKVIRIACPDIGAGRHSSSGTPVIDHLYVNRLLEREFRRDGIRVEWAFFKNAGPAVNEAFANDQIDIAFLGDFAAIIGESAGNRTRLLATAVRGLNGYLGVVPGSGHHDLASLRGKTIGVWMGTAAQLSLDAVLASQGYSARDFKLISLDSGASMAALAAKRVDAVWSAAGMLAMRKVGLAEIPVSTQGGDGAGTIALLLLGATPFVERHPDLTARIVRVLVQSAQWAADPRHQDTLIELMAKQTTLPADLLSEELLRGKPLQARTSPLLDPFLLSHLQYGADASLKARLIRRPVDVGRWVEPRFLHQALADLKLQGRWPEQEAYDNPWQ